MVTLLAVGDIHLGRRPTHLVELLADHGIGVAELTPVAAWRAVVQEALRRRVDGLLLAGDVVDAADDRFEAYGHLERGVRRLVEAGVEVFGVAGNHDVEALPRLARRIDGFRLLGEGGEWEVVELDGGCELLGWSFPAARVEGSPLAAGLPPRGAAATRIGLLHCDVDGGTSSYAPVARAALEAAQVDAWLLGHIHRPDPLAGPRPVGYLGSLVGLDPGEGGRHGAWLVEAEAGRVGVQPVAPAPLRWEGETVAIDAVTGEGEAREEAVAALLTAALEAVHRRIEGEGAPRAVGCRLRLVGAHPDHAAVVATACSEAVARTHLVRGETVYFIERVVDEARPALDLAALARGDDPPGLLARHLLSLAGEEPDPALLREARRRLDGVAARPWPGLAAEEVDPRPILWRAGLRALEQLLAQRGQR